MEVEINKLSDAIKLKKLFIMNDLTQLDIKLFDENKEYSVSQLEILDILEKIIKKSHNTKLNIRIHTLNEKLPKDIFNKLCQFHKNIGNPSNFDIVVRHCYTDDDVFNYTYKVWDIKTITKANTEIEKVCQFIKNSNFSPMEAFAYIHGYVQKVAKYTASKDNSSSWCANDQFIAGAYMKLPEIVCMGYCTLMEAIIKELNMPGLHCDIMTINFKNMIKNYDENHARCVVNVNDSKYGINQCFFDDPTWDSSVDCKYPVFTHFAMKSDSHDYGKSVIYHYYEPKHINIYGKDRKYTTNTFDERSVRLNNSEIKMNQQLVEKIYFNVLQRVYKNGDFNTLYGILQKMTKASFLNQKHTKFNGYIAKQNPILTKEKAMQMFEKNYDQNSENLLKI